MADFKDIDETLPSDGRVLVKFHNGRVVSVRIIRDDEHIASFRALIELAGQAGYQIFTPEGKPL
ncbi:hypothetical protein PMPD1_1724 [Paramixta manurensis]|uniref:Phage protein n=1 Tax=Paramixta manurensis TaxID=2740817 RepID=A0A6M8UAW3_9GAMM|nr:hypothetical protein PMPD1_1724 [Erwiniaceae bacterium PD-1]